ncbi:hypothetical protein [Aquibacillus kalidii]|uniref:hypothetical protein n=1 Tax=Aquibacillus kalidii TaxID=2762597 RepID=UPI0016486ABA|nr:hypothetical protein [Aquibacillus kalidii]
MGLNIKKFLLVVISILLGFFTYKLPIINQIFNYKTSFDISAFYLMILMYFFTQPVEKKDESESTESVEVSNDDE